MSNKGRIWDLLAFFSAVLLAISFHYYKNLQETIGVFREWELNNTQRSDQDGLVFNRVPKVGSETIWGLIDRLSPINGFTSYSDNAQVKASRGGENTFLRTSSERLHYVNILNQNCSKPYSYVKHVNFLDTSEFGYTNPIYINFVRHPVDRVISWYYYKRTPWHLIRFDKDTNKVKMSENIPPIQELKMTFEECVLSGYHECIFNPGQSFFTGFGGSHYSQIAFFCGHGPECSNFETREALEKAKSNVDKYYAVVGVLEDMTKSLEILERYVPKYFRDARRVYKEMMSEEHKNKNIYKPKTPAYIRQSLMANFTLEIEFYEYCKQRLNKQFLLMN